MDAQLHNSKYPAVEGLNSNVVMDFVHTFYRCHVDTKINIMKSVLDTLLKKTVLNKIPFQKHTCHKPWQESEAIVLESQLRLEDMFLFIVIEITVTRKRDFTRRR